MAETAKVGIQFVADAGSVPAVTDKVKADIESLGKLAPKLALNVDVAKIRGELADLGRNLPTIDPFKAIDAGASLGNIRKQLDGVLNTPALSAQAAGYRQITIELEAWSAKNQDVLADNKALAATYETLKQSAQTGLGEATRRAGDLAQIGQQVTSALSGVSNFLGGMAAGALGVAANFEQLQAKLVSVTGSAEKAAEKFDFAKSFAATTPFDVAGIVNATALLEGYGQKAEEVLPAAANLAAAMGTSLEDATRAIGKAASGSLEGFQSLRDVYAISTNDLKKFGLQVDSTGAILARTPTQIAKNRDALLQLIQVRYGDAIARQSDTLNGAISNLGDTVQQLTNDAAKGLLPFATIGVRALTSLLNVVNAIPGPIKTAAAGLVVLAAGATGLAASLAGVVVGAVTLQAGLLGIAGTLGATSGAATLLTGAATLLTGAAGGIGAALAGAGAAASRFGAALLATNPILAATLAAVVGLSIATEAYNSKQVTIGNEVNKSADALANSSSSLKTVIAAINDAGKEVGVTASIVGNSRAQYEQLNQAFEKLSAEQLVNSLSKMGETSDTLAAKLKALESSAVNVDEQLKLLAQARTALSDGDIVGFEEARRALEGYGIQVQSGTGALASLEDQAKKLNFELGKIGAARAGLTQAIAAFQQFAAPFEQVTANAKALQGFLDLSKQVGSAQALANALQSVNAQIRANADVAGIGTDNLDKLLAKLADPRASDLQKAAIQSQIGLIQQRADLEKAEADRQQALTDTKIAEIERAANRKKALNQLSLQDELKTIQEELGIVKSGTDAEIALLQRQSDVKAAIRQKELASAQAAFQALQQSNQDALQGASVGGDRSGQIAAIEGVIAKTAAWRDANAAVLQQFPQIATELSRLERSQALQLQREQAQLARDNVAGLAREINNMVSDSATNQQKLATLTASLNVLTGTRGAKLFEEKALEEQILSLQRQKLATEQAIAAEKERQQGQIQSAVLAVSAQEIQILEQKKAAGQNVEAELARARQERLQLELEAIETAKAAAIKAGADVELAETEAAIKRQQVYNAETIRKNQENQKQENDLKSSLKRREDAVTASANRIGGRNSPILSADEAFGQGFLGDFRLGDLRKPQAPRPVPPQVLPPGPPVPAGSNQTPGQAPATSDASAGGGRVATTNILNFNGVSMNGPEFEGAVMTIIRKANASEQNKRGA